MGYRETHERAKGHLSPAARVEEDAKSLTYVVDCDSVCLEMVSGITIDICSPDEIIGYVPDGVLT